jgi:hypothetical protein
MADQIENRHVDKRVVHRYLKKNVLDEKEWEKHLKSLPDLADQAVAIEAAMEGEPEDEGDDEA